MAEEQVFPSGARYVVPPGAGPFNAGSAVPSRWDEPRSDATQVVVGATDQGPVAQFSVETGHPQTPEDVNMRTINSLREQNSKSPGLITEIATQDGQPFLLIGSEVDPDNVVNYGIGKQGPVSVHPNLASAIIENAEAGRRGQSTSPLEVLVGKIEQTGVHGVLKKLIGGEEMGVWKKAYNGAKEKAQKVIKQEKDALASAEAAYEIVNGQGNSRAL